MKDDHRPIGPSTVVAVGASAGGVEALQEFVSSLPAGLKAAVVVAVHGRPGSRLDLILTRAGNLPVTLGVDGQSLADGSIVVVPGGNHVLFQDDKLILLPAFENTGYRPSVDMMLVSLGAAYRDRGIGIILSGTMKDGTQGAQALNRLGGRMLVQDPDEAQYSSMPDNVIEHDHPEAVLKAGDLALRVADIVGVVAKTA